ncbi:MAG: rhodanese-like domain-containing protein [Rhodospirillales bacterium]
MTAAHHDDHRAAAFGFSRRRLTAGLILLAGAGALGAAFAATGGDILSVEETLRRVQSNQITLIDVRSPAEWRQAGIAKGAKTITIHDPLGAAGFVAKVTAALAGDLERPVALICATGVRSRRAERILRRAGVRNVHNVREGMLGNLRDGPGWLKRGLPTQPCDC